MAKKKREIVALKCEESGDLNYTIYKPNNLTEKLRVKKYSKRLKKHTWHVETKLSK